MAQFKLKEVKYYFVGKFFISHLFNVPLSKQKLNQFKWDVLNHPLWKHVCGLFMHMKKLHAYGLGVFVITSF